MGGFRVVARSLVLAGLCGTLGACGPTITCSGSETTGLLDRIVLKKFKDDPFFPTAHDDQAVARIDMISTTGQAGNVTSCVANLVVGASGKARGSTHRFTYKVTLSDDQKHIYVEAEVGRMMKVE